MEEQHLERTTVCRQEKLRYLAFGTRRNFLETQTFCRTLSGDIAVTTGPESVKNIQEALDNIGGSQVGSGSDFIYFLGQHFQNLFCIRTNKLQFSI